MVSAGYDIEFDAFKVGPTASIQYSRLSIEDYTETGAGALNLSLDRQTAESLLSTIGLRITTLIERTGMQVIPELRVSFQHEFEDQSRSITARFASGGGGAFSFNTTEIGQDSALVGAGVTFNANQWSSFVDYTAELGRKDFSAHTIRVGARLSF